MKKLALLAMVALSLASCKKEVIQYSSETLLEVTRKEYLSPGMVQPLHIKKILNYGEGWVHYELYDDSPAKLTGKFYDTMVRPYRGKH